jgi:enamine deaminase RidA (YjgF/YER057c/UK114 family)
MSSGNQQTIKYLTPNHMKRLPFSEAVQAGNMLYLSGQIGIDLFLEAINRGEKNEKKIEDRIVYILN